MSSFQSTLEDRDIADVLAETQRQISIAEFFEKNKQMLGFDSKARALVTTVKEAVDNSLDAAEEAGFLPDIYIEIRETGDYYTVIVEDNGPGITKDQIPKVFGKLLYGSRFHVREQKRGQQGLGISAAVMYAQLTSGKPAEITSRTPSGEVAQYFELIIDTEENEPEIQEESTTSWERPHGTRIEMHLEANMRARRQLHDYIRHTAVVNPHARIELVEPNGSFKADRATDQLPEQTESIRPHPHGVELGTVMKMLEATESYSLSGFLQGEFTRVGGKTADEIIDAFRDRYFGREMTWDPPRPEQADLEQVVIEAVANKSAEATAAFAARVTDGITDRAPVAHHDVVRIVDRVADDIEDEFDTIFGATVRGNAVSAAWHAVTADRVTRLYALVDGATTDRKDDEVVRGMADRLARKFDAAPDEDRVTRATIREYVDRSADMLVEHEDASFGETARENVVTAIWDAMATVPDPLPKVREVAADRDAAAALLDAMRSVDVMAPPTNCLAPIRAELIEEGLRKEVNADFYAAVTRDAEVHGGDPFIVEAGIAHGGDLEEDRVDLMRFANRVPLVYQQGACAITDVVRGIDWRNYGLDQPGGSGLPNGPAVVMVHVASTNVPFTSESKDAVANIPAIEKEIELAVREAARELKTHLNQRRSLEQRRRKQTVIREILPKMAEKVASVTGRATPDVEVTLSRIMNNVLVRRRVENGTVELVVENHTTAGADLDVTEITTVEPTGVSAGTTVDMDGEWFIKWAPSVAAGETATLTYDVPGDDGEVSFDVNVDGIAPEKLTIQS